MNWTQRFAWALFRRWSGRGDRIPVAFGPLLRTEARPILLLALTVLVASLVSSLSPLVFSGAVARLTEDGVGRGFLLFLGLYILLLGINRALVETRTMRSARVEQGISVALSERYFSHILHLDEDFFHDRNPSRLLSILHTGRHGTRLLVQVGFSILLPGVLEIGFALIILAGFVDLYIATFVGLYGLIHISITAHSLKKLTPLYRQADEATHRNAALLGNALHAVETIRHFGGERTIIGRYRSNLHHIRERWHAFYTGRTKYAVLLAVVLVLQFGLGMWWLFERNNGVVPVAEFVLFNMILLQLTRPFELMGNAVRDIGQAVTLFEPIVDILSTQPQVAQGVSQTELRHVGRIDFDHVYFLRGQRLIIDNVSFTLDRGSFTVVLGETGSGKSTLLKLLLGSVPADDGQVLINGTPVAHYTRRSLYEQAALVPQDIALLNDSVLFNITLGRACTDEQVREAVRRAHLEQTLERLPDGLHTLVGERGLKLSGGERQRIAIARALLTGPSLLLLDEASSALDGDTEAAIMDDLREMLPDLTVIAVSHRTGIIRPTDNRITLDHGRAVFHPGTETGITGR